MIGGIFVLLLCQLVGEVLSRGLSLPAPGPVIGLGLLTAGLWLRNWVKPFTEETLAETGVWRASTALLGVLSLLFVPAGVGVIQYLQMLSEHGVAIVVSLVVSTLLTLLATVGAFLIVKRWTAKAEDGP